MKTNYAVFEEEHEDNFIQWTVWLTKERALDIKSTLVSRFPSKVFLVLKKVKHEPAKK